MKVLSRLQLKTSGCQQRPQHRLLQQACLPNAGSVAHSLGLGEPGGDSGGLAQVLLSTSRQHIHASKQHGYQLLCELTA